MAYADEVARTELSLAVELYDFFAQGTYFSYCAGDQDVTFNGRIYAASPISRNRFSADIELKGSEITLQIGMKDPFLKFIAKSPYLPVDVIITRVYPTVTQMPSVCIFTGTVMGIKIEGITIALSCISDGGAFERKLLRIYYQTFCNHRVFDTACGIDEYSYELITTVQAVVTETQLTITAAAGYANDYFTGGCVNFNGDQRLITDHTGSTIKIMLGIVDLVLGSTVHMIPGCDGNPATCRDKYNNLNRFCGFPYIPTKNPIIWGFK